MIDHPCPYIITVNAKKGGWLFSCEACGIANFVWEYQHGEQWVKHHDSEVMREGMPVTWEMNRRPTR